MSGKPKTKVVSLRLRLKTVETLDKRAREEHRCRGNMLALMIERNLSRPKENP